MMYVVSNSPPMGKGPQVEYYKTWTIKRYERFFQHQSNICFSYIV